MGAGCASVSGAGLHVCVELVDGGLDLRIRTDHEIEVELQTCNLPQTLQRMFQKEGRKIAWRIMACMGPRLSPVTPAWQSPSTPRPSMRVIEDVGSLLKLWDAERETLRTDIVSCKGRNANCM